MATVIENKKNGKTVSFKFRAYLRRNEIGKQINKYTTWFAPDDLTPAKALKAAEQAAEEREAKIKEEYERDVVDHSECSYHKRTLSFQIWCSFHTRHFLHDNSESLSLESS